jgi:hypothetical protein
MISRSSYLTPAPTSPNNEDFQRARNNWKMWPCGDVVGTELNLMIYKTSESFEQHTTNCPPTLDHDNDSDNEIEIISNSETLTVSISKNVKTITYLFLLQADDVFLRNVRMLNERCSPNL